MHFTYLLMKRHVWTRPLSRPVSCRVTLEDPWTARVHKVPGRSMVWSVLDLLLDVTTTRSPLSLPASLTSTAGSARWAPDVRVWYIHKAKKYCMDHTAGHTRCKLIEWANFEFHFFGWNCKLVEGIKWFQSNTMRHNFFFCSVPTSQINTVDWTHEWQNGCWWLLAVDSHWMKRVWKWLSIVMCMASFICGWLLCILHMAKKSFINVHGACVECPIFLPHCHSPTCICRQFLAVKITAGSCCAYVVHGSCRICCCQKKDHYSDTRYRDTK